MLNLIKLANEANKANNSVESTYKTNNNKTQVNQSINQTDNKKIINKIKAILNFIKNNEGKYEIRDKEKKKVLIFIDNDGLTIGVDINWTEIEVDMNWTEIEDSTFRKIVESLEQQWLLADFIERLEYNKKNEDASIKKLLNL